ncbi:hypothetical protein N8J89_39815 [Crossiella sp. CA-258035]|uniref:hypothetical protein n=1 Tax=Crossiella sp. CA-258035 TaxID=2981138 RepID=UPI0024BD30B2|nr:hypothetical protein [Crossiella sp. CA-258035]WHT19172.1 hypothetical protein N8J89_39815 [Crossiella sp. CA-258035]
MSTRQDSRSVLFVVHTVASANRLLDLVPLFDADLRVALHFTCPEDSTAPEGVAECFAALGIQPLSWQAALAAKFDLAITANHRGDLHELSAPVMIVSHGVGYTKNSPGNRKSEIGNRKSEIGLRPFAGVRAARRRGHRQFAGPLPFRTARPPGQGRAAGPRRGHRRR